MDAIRLKSAVKAAFVAAAMFAAPAAAAFVSAPSADAAADTSVLMPGEQLYAGQSLVNGQYTMAMQTDGNFVVYAGNQSLWQSGTSGNPNAWVIMQSDGNLVVYSPGPTDVHALWQSGTYNQPGDRLVVQPDGNAVIYNSSYTSAPWATNTNAHPSQQLAFFDDTAGPLVHSIFVQGPNQNGIAASVCVATPAHTTIPSNWWWSARSYVYTYYSNNCTGQQVTPRLWIDIDGNTPYRCLSDVPPYSDWSCAAPFTTGAVKAPLPGGPIEITDPGKSGKCSNVAVITARGTNEGGRKDPHANSVGTAAYKLASRLPNGTPFKVMPLDYPATLQGFFGSISEGIRVLANLISVQINQCVTQQIVLIGHSQGSAVIEQYLSKYAGQGVPGSGGVVSDWITHVTLFGDPMRVPSESIDRSVMPTPWPGFIGPLPGDVQLFTSEPGFMAAVGMTENLPPAFTTSVNGLTRAISWCNIGDGVCDVPGALGSETFNPLAFHNYGGDYVQNPAADAAATHVINALPTFSLKG